MTTAATRNLFDDGTRRTLAELRTASLPRCTPQDAGVVFTIRPEHIGDPEAERTLAAANAQVATYLAAFVAHDGCVKCGAVLGGNDGELLSAFLGTFRWGLAHGEGCCGRCGYPARGIHRIDLGDGGEFTMSRILQYHPDALREESPSPTDTQETSRG